MQVCVRVSVCTIYCVQYCFSYDCVQSPFVCMYIHTHAHAYLHTPTHTRLHTHLHTHAYTHLHTHNTQSTNGTVTSQFCRVIEGQQNWSLQRAGDVVSSPMFYLYMYMHIYDIADDTFYWRTCL